MVNIDSVLPITPACIFNPFPPINIQIFACEIVTLLNKNGFQIDLEIEKSQESDNTSVYKITASFSNQLNTALSALTFRVAVPKTLQLKLDPQSAQVVEPFSKKSVTQAMTIRVPAEVGVVRMRYHVSYVLSGKTIEEQGEFNQFP